MESLALSRFDMKKIKPTNVCVFVASRNSGKCLAKGTEVMMYDGSIKKIEDIKTGEFVMGDDSTKRKVIGTTSGVDEMFEVENTKGIKYTVNSHHVLSLKQTSKKNICFLTRKRSNPHYDVKWFDNKTFNMTSKYFNINNGSKKEDIFEIASEFYDSIVDDLYVDIPLKSYLLLSESKKKNLLGYQVPIQFKNKNVEIDPYMLGFWLGDGSSHNTNITSQDSCVVKYFSENLKKYGLYLEFLERYGYKISTGVKGQKGNLFKEFLEKNNLIKNKHIPDDYKINSRENRLKLLAGFIDADGHYDGYNFEITQTSKNERILDDFIFVAKSLGFVAYKKEKKTSWTYKGIKKTCTSFRIHLNGGGIHEIPTKCPRKKARKRAPREDALVSSIKVSSKGKGEYCGFELDGNHRFVLGNFIVTHNSFLIRDLMYHHQNIPAGMVVSKTDKLTHYYEQFIPPILIHEEYSPQILDKLFDRQKKALKEEWPNPHAFLIFDDTISDANVWKRDTRIKEIFFNGRHYKILFLLTMQDPKAITPGLRANIDFSFILRTPNQTTRRTLYENYCGMFPSYEIFEKVLDSCTEDYGCLVIDNTSRSNKLEDQVFFYKASDHEPFKICSNAYWQKKKQVISNNNATSSSSTLKNSKKFTIIKKN
jgi:hypothetical protein